MKFLANDLVFFSAQFSKANNFYIVLTDSVIFLEQISKKIVHRKALFPFFFSLGPDHFILVNVNKYGPVNLRCPFIAYNFNPQSMAPGLTA